MKEAGGRCALQAAQASSRMDACRRILVAALAVASAAWLVCISVDPGGTQRKVAVAGEFLGDFVDYANARGQAGCPDAYFGEEHAGIRAVDRPYLPLSYDMFRFFSSDVRMGGAAFAIVSTAVFALAFLLLLCRKGVPFRWAAVLAFAAALSSPLLAAAGNANTISVAATGVVLWMALKDEKSPWLRAAAVVALAFASTMKITPAIFATCYLKERRFREFLAFGAVAAALSLVPFAWYGGFDGFCAWLSNAKANASFYRSKGAWGVVPVDRMLRVLGGMSAYETLDWPTLGLSRAVNVAAGIACFVAALPRGRGTHATLVMLTGALLLVPGNMHFYTGLYLFVPFAAWLSDPSPGNSGRGKIVNSLAAVCWFLIFSPLQIPFGPGCLNHPLANMAFLGLLAATFLQERAAR